MQFKCGKISFTKWDRIEFKCAKNEEMTLGYVFQKLEDSYQCKVTMMSASFGAETRLIYANWEPLAERESWLKQPYVLLVFFLFLRMLHH